MHCKPTLRSACFAIGLTCSFNQRAQRAYKKGGFKEEGVLRAAVMDNGVYGDIILLSILEEEWRSMETITTKRLLFRKIRTEDSQEIFDTWANDAKVAKYLTWIPHESLETTKMVVEAWVKAYEEDVDCFRYGLVRKEDQKLIGMIDVVRIKDGCPEIGYVLGRAYWNQGYMSEALEKVVAILFQKYPSILISAQEENIASNRVIQKNGFIFIGKESRQNSAMKPENITLCHYRRNREER